MQHINDLGGTKKDISKSRICDILPCTKPFNYTHNKYKHGVSIYLCLKRKIFSPILFSLVDTPLQGSSKIIY